MKKVNAYWKTIAIIFIILFVLLGTIIGTFLFIGLNISDNQNYCAIEICKNVEDSMAYYYNENDQTCTCINEQGETILQTYLGPIS